MAIRYDGCLYIERGGQGRTSRTLQHDIRTTGTALMALADPSLSWTGKQKGGRKFRLSIG